MRLFFKRLLLFCAILIPGYLLILTVWAQIPYSYIGTNFLYRQGDYGHLNTRLKEIPNYGEVDVLFVGSSRIYRGIDPRIFKENNIKVFVLGSSSQTPLHSYILLKRYMNDLNPKLVVFDILPSSFAIKGVEPSLDLIANDKIDEFNFKLAMIQNDIMVWNTLFYAYIRQIIGLHDDFKEKVYKPRNKDTYISGGYVHKGILYKGLDTCDTLGSKKWREPIPLQLNYFKKMIRFVEESNKEILFINMPIAHYDCFNNNNIILDSLGLLQNYKYVNYNTTLSLRDSIYFYDEYHLNERGVEKLDNYMINELMNITSNK